MGEAVLSESLHSGMIDGFVLERGIGREKLVFEITFLEVVKLRRVIDGFCWEKYLFYVYLQLGNK